MNIPLCCDSCERKPASCFGVYEVEPDAAPSFCCDDCCGHGNEDGWCKPIAEYDTFLAEAFAELSKLRGQNDTLRRQCDAGLAFAERLLVSTSAHIRSTNADGLRAVVGAAPSFCPNCNCSFCALLTGQE